MRMLQVLKIYKLPTLLYINHFRNVQMDAFAGAVFFLFCDLFCACIFEDKAAIVEQRFAFGLNSMPHASRPRLPSVRCIAFASYCAW